MAQARPEFLEEAPVTKTRISSLLPPAMHSTRRSWMASAAAWIWLICMDYLCRSAVSRGARTSRRRRKAHGGAKSTAPRLGRERNSLGTHLGKRMTSRMAGASVSSMTRRSMPMPQPPVGAGRIRGRG